MKVAFYKAVGNIEIQERPIPKAGPGQAVIKIKLNGICGTDMHLYFNGDVVVKPGIVLGHENVGTVYELGEGVTGFKIGDRVVAGPPGPCGECYFCMHGHSNICIKAFPNTNGLMVDGGEAEYMLVKDPKYMLTKIPDNLSFEDAVLTDTIATAYRGVTQSAFKMGDNVVVSGAGPIGLSVISILKMGGARHITALEVVEARQKLALDLGADVVFDPKKEGDKLIGKINDLYGGIGPDLVIEAAGVSQSFELCTMLPRAGGQLLNLGVNSEPSKVIQALMVVKELNIKSSLAYGIDEERQVIDLMSTGKLKTRGLYSGSVPLVDIVEKGFKRLAADKSLIKLAVAP